MAQVRKTGPTPEDIAKDVSSGHIAPIYILEGEEPYYTDRLSDFLVKTLTTPETTDFDMDLQYGLETDAGRIVQSCRQYPLLGERRVILVREAQQMKGSMDALQAYAATPSERTVLIMCFKGTTMDRRKAAAKALAKAAVVCESKHLFESAIPGFITRNLKARGISMEQKGIDMMVEHVGTDLTRMDSEIDKLVTALPQGETIITTQMVEQQTGLSREYNNFELVSALAQKNKPQALKIVKYFYNNPRAFALPATLATLFGFYADLMEAYYAPDKTDGGVAEFLRQPEWKVRREIMPAMRKYNARKVLNILTEIRRTDAKSKGAEGCRMAHGDLLLELVLYILD